MALNEQNEIYLIKEFRYPIQRWSIELPCGSTNRGNPLEAAKRELKEETGLIAKNWQKIGEFEPHRGICKETDPVYLATNLTDTKQHERHEEGITEVFTLPFATIEEWIKNGKIRDGQSIAALLLAKAKLNL